MTRQLDRLIDTTLSSNTEIRVLPFSAGAHAAIIGSFTLLEFSPSADLHFHTDQPDVVYLDGPHGETLQEDPAKVDWYANAFDNLRDQAFGLDDSVRLLASIKNGLA